LKHDVPQYRKDITCHGNVPQVLLAARTTVAK